MAKPFFDLDAMLTAAEKTTGLSDWGDDDIRTPLEILFKALNEEAELSDQGVARTKAYLHLLLSQRLKLFGDRKTYPEIAQQKIEKPIFMGGMPRAGTSFLNSLISRDPNVLALLQWQVVSLSPPPNHPDIDHRAQIAAATEFLRENGWFDDYLREKYDYDPMKAAEDSAIMEYSFVSEVFPYLWNVPSYGAYFFSADRAPAYRIEKKILQALQYGVTGKTWLVKAPPHISQLGLLFDMCPDARLIVNHRDPTKVIPSLMSLQTAHRRQYGNRPVAQDRAFALVMLEVMAKGFDDMIQWRKDPAVNRAFVDVNYVDLERDPMAAVERIYKELGMKLDDTARAQMRTFIAENRKGKFGAHRYRIEDTGLTADEVRARFKLYLKHFDVPIEG
jgi:hypothetical protein